MIDFDEALALLADNVRPLGCEQVELAAAHGRVLVEDVHAAISLSLIHISEPTRPY